ncbi:Glutathione S-transferase [Macleaya cordata]|uniref:glutathione transferase n=1 Tax=Macleaya cordata TaxID=56857 RepID=A0A200R821_MACCD|nr:Glutathione S-transferase [Macleaya cordata]
MADEVVLLDFWPSPFGMRVRMALAEKGIKYEYKEENLREKSPLLLKMNPIHKKIPILIHNIISICESLVIVEYIDKVWKNKTPLLPSDPYESHSKVYDYGKKLWMTKGEEHEKVKKEFIEILKVLEGELGKKSYFGGAKMGFLDLAFIPYYTWFYTYEKCGKFSIEEECPKLVSWAKKCMEKENVSESLPEPEKVYEELEKLYPIE